MWITYFENTLNIVCRNQSKSYICGTKANNMKNLSQPAQAMLNKINASESKSIPMPNGRSGMDIVSELYYAGFVNTRWDLNKVVLEKPVYFSTK